MSADEKRRVDRLIRKNRGYSTKPQDRGNHGTVTSAILHSREELPKYLKPGYNSKRSRRIRAMELQHGQWRKKSRGKRPTTKDDGYEYTLCQPKKRYHIPKNPPRPGNLNDSFTD